MSLSDQAANNSYDHVVSCSLQHDHGDVTQEQMLLSQLGSAAKERPSIVQFSWKTRSLEHLQRLPSTVGVRCTLNELNPFKGAIDLIM